MQQQKLELEPEPEPHREGKGRVLFVLLAGSRRTLQMEWISRRASRTISVNVIWRSGNMDGESEMIIKIQRQKNEGSSRFGNVLKPRERRREKEKERRCPLPPLVSVFR